MQGIRGWLRELRGAAGGYEDERLRQAFPGLSAGAVRAASLGALQAAAGAVARALASGAVTGDRGSLTSETRYAIGYDMVRSGQFVALLQIQRDGSARLMRADANSPTYGGPDRESWRYSLTIGGPSHTRTLTAPAASVAHVLWNSESITPWRGRSPIAVAAASGSLAACVADSLTNEAAVTVARVVPMPAGQKRAQAQAIVDSIRRALGHLSFVETAYAGGGGGRASAPAADWKAQRYGYDAPDSQVKLHQLMNEEIAVACGVPAAMMAGARSAGPAMKEAFRQFLLLTVEPLAALVAAEVGRVIESPVRISFDALAAVDAPGRARAVHVLTEAGIDKSEAMRRAGWVS